MFKKIFTTLTLVSFLAGVALPVMAETDTIQSPQPTPTKSPKRVQLDSNCMIAAVEKRDTAIIAALDGFYGSAKAALTARKEALKAGWALPELKDKKTAIKKAWRDYRLALEKTRKDFRNARKAAWQQFRTDRKNCGPGTTSIDNTSEGVDNSL